MNLGLGNLADLKAFALPASHVSDTSFDEALQAIGKGVAGAFERACNRKFARLVGAQDEFDAARSMITLPRFPIETITAIEHRASTEEGWVALDVIGTLRNRFDSAGLIEVFGPQGPASDRLRITYTGGFWFDENEDFSGTLPAGATLLPADLKLAWQVQCIAVLRDRDKLSMAPIREDAKTPVPSDFSTFLPQVAETLRSYTRFA